MTSRFGGGGESVGKEVQGLPSGALVGSRRHVVRRDQVHGALGGVLLLPELHHSFAQRTIAQPGVRHDVPA